MWSLFVMSDNSYTGADSDVRWCDAKHSGPSLTGRESQRRWPLPGCWATTSSWLRLQVALALVTLAALGGCALMPAGKQSDQGSAKTVAAGPATLDGAADAAEPAPPDATKTGPEVSWQDITIQQAAPPAGIWERIRQGFSLPDGNEQRVQAQLRWYEEHPGYMTRTAERAKPYLYYVVQQVQKRGLPMELALLPIVESAYDPFGYSNASASGLWQFVAQTGRLFGIREDWWYDGRRDVASSTRAALSYLEQLHQRFNGNWLLALAAYNTGPGRVEWAIAYNRRHDQPIDFWHLRLPLATRNYVPRLLAVRDLILTPKKYGIDLPFIANAPYLARVKLKGQIDLAVAAQMAGISLKQMYLLNPGYNRWATPPGRDASLFIPLDDKVRFVSQFDQMRKKVEVQWVAHRIRAGQTLRGIARRHHVTVAELKRRNGIRGSIIRAGHTLMVPSASEHYTRYVLSQPMRTASTQDERHGPREVELRVHAGDTLWGISRVYDVSADNIAKWNNMAPHDPLHVGQKLVIWEKAGATVALGAHGARYPIRAVRRIRYTVHHGDSLSEIADRFNVSLHKLAVWNSLSLSSVLHPGQRLTVFVDVRNEF